MSLVAAYSDSENDDSDNEGIVEKVEAKQNEINKNSPVTDNTNEDNPNEDDPNEDDPNDQDDVPIMFDDDDWESNVSNTLFTLLPQPKAAVVKYSFVDENEILDDEFLLKKPKPPKVPLKSIPEEKVKASNNKTDIVLDESKDTDGKASSSRGFLNLPKPSKKKREKVKISLPQLQETGSDDSDTDVDMTPSLKVQPNNSNMRSCLFSMLPKPKSSVTVGENKHRMFDKKNNRPLVPHTLTKKSTAKNNLKISTDNKSNLQNTKGIILQNEDDSDEEEEMTGGNFFSLGDDAVKSKSEEKIHVAEIFNPVIISSRTTLENKDKLSTKVNKNIESGKVITSSNTLTTNVTAEKTLNVSGKPNNIKNNSFFASLLKTKKDTSTNKTVIRKNILNSEASKINNTTPSNISATESYESVTTPYSSVTEPYSSVTEPYNAVTQPYSSVTEPYNAVTQPYSSVTEPYSAVTQPYSSVTEPYGTSTAAVSNVTAPYGQQVGNYGNQTGQSNSYQQSSERFFEYAYDKQKPKVQQGQKEVDYYNQPNQDLPIAKEALTSLQGKGKRRHTEDINIIDINADNLQRTNKDYLLNLSKQSGYKPDPKSKDDQPSHKQKRKHQITYLAFQAKERELELQQSWSESRSMKQQTQSRYGF